MNFGQIESQAAQAYQAFSGQSPENRRKNPVQYMNGNTGDMTQEHAMSAFAYFRQADGDKDGLISRQEYSTATGIPMDKLQENLFGALNYDGQTGVGIKEAATSLLYMDWMDTNGSKGDGKAGVQGRNALVNDDPETLTQTLEQADKAGKMDKQYQEYLQGLQQTNVAQQPEQEESQPAPVSGDWNGTRAQRRQQAGVGSISEEIAKKMQERPAATEQSESAEQPQGTEKPEGTGQTEEKPATEPKPQTYGVRFGDTYWNIAEAIRKNNNLEASQDDVINALREQVGDADTQLQVGRQVNVDDIVNKFKPQTEETGASEEGASKKTEGASSTLTQGFRQHLQSRLASDNELSQKEFNEAAQSFVESQKAAGKTVHFDRTKLYEAFNATKGVYDNSGLDSQIEIQDLVADEGKADEALSRLGLHEGADAPSAEALATEYLTRMQDLEKFNQFSNNSDSLYLYQFMNSIENFVNEKKAAGEDIHFDPSLESTLFHEMKGAMNDSGLDLTVSYNDIRSGKARDIIARFFATH